MGPSKFLVAAISALALSGGVEGSRHRRRNGGGCSPKPIETTVTYVVEPTVTSVTDIFEPTETSFTDIIETTITDVVEPTETSITDIVETIETTVTDAVEPTETSATDIFESTETAITDIVEPTEATATDTLEPVETIETTVTEIVIPIETVATDIEATETSVTEIIEPTPTPTISIPDEESSTSIVPVCTNVLENPSFELPLETDPDFYKGSRVEGLVVNSDPNSVIAPDGSKYALITANQYNTVDVQQTLTLVDPQSTYKLTFQWAYGQQQTNLAGCYFSILAGGEEVGEVQQLTTGPVGVFTEVSYTFTPIADYIGFALYANCGINAGPVDILLDDFSIVNWNDPACNPDATTSAP